MKVHPKIMVKGSHQVNQVGEKNSLEIGDRCFPHNSLQSPNLLFII